eukprot:1733131-Lingulodinium_polyedra.AAC.1
MVVVRVIGHALLKHASDAVAGRIALHLAGAHGADMGAAGLQGSRRLRLVGRIALHLAEAHGTDVHAAGTDDSRDLGVHKGSVAALRLWAGRCTAASTVVVKELLRRVAACYCNCSATGNVAISKDSATRGQRTELAE